MNGLTVTLAVCLSVMGEPALPLRDSQGQPVQQVELRWQHSVEKTEWRELWAATPSGLHLRQAKIRGSGAGMEPPPEARLDQGWYVYTPPLLSARPLLTFPDSTHSDGLRLCFSTAADTAHCPSLAAMAGRAPGDTRPLELKACPP